MDELMVDPGGRGLVERGVRGGEKVGHGSGGVMLLRAV